MTKLPSRFLRLDAILGDLPVHDPILLTELDGYLTAVVVSPEEMSPALWMPPIWGGGYGAAPPFEDPIDVRQFGEMVMARHDEIERDLERGRPMPVYDVEGHNGAVVWEAWVGGFEMAMAVHPDGWSAASGDATAAEAIASMRTLADVAFDRSSLTGEEINAICDEAPTRVSVAVMALYASRVRPDAAPGAAARPAKIGRNDPCPCGSGKKFKRCCAAV